MSDIEKNITQNGDDGISELMDAFAEYDEVETDVRIEADDEISDEGTADEVPEAEVEDEPEVKEPKAKHRKEKSAKDKKEKVKKDASHKGDEEHRPASPIRLVVVLTAICAAVALLLATVNHFTVDKIAENTEKAMLNSIREIFDSGVQAESVSVPEGTELTTLYLVTKNGGVCGYAASVAPNGFGGPMSLMVGVDSDGAIVGVEIVSMSETPGLGSRVGGDDFLSRFIGKSGQITVDAISGATISSKAVMEGVNSVISGDFDLAGMASERGLDIVKYDSSETASETEVPTTEVPATDPIVTEVPVTVSPVTEQVPPDVSKGDSPPQNINDNPNDVNEGIHAEYKEDTAEYETLTTEPETSEAEDKER